MQASGNRREICVAATQMKCAGWDLQQNILKGEEMIREAAKKGAHIVLLQVRYWFGMRGLMGSFRNYL